MTGAGWGRWGANDERGALNLVDARPPIWQRGEMARRKPRRPCQCQTHPCRRRATTRVVWHMGRVTYQCDRHAAAAQRVSVRAGLPLWLTTL